MMNSDDIKRNIEAILRKIAALNSSCRLLGVTKTFPAEAIEAAISAGLYEFGESKAQEAGEKIPGIKARHENVKWHFIGHLQTNKINKVVPLFDAIQSVDSLKLAEKISEALKRENRELDILLEVKVSGEDTKFGVEPGELGGIVEGVKKMSNLRIKGLMAMAPYSDNPENARPYFKKARRLFEEIKRAGTEMEILSMGMSDDYMAAMEEGSTMIRIGTGIFGRRSY
jgi:pyridoxal phosphate enzyme (YggS family)